MAKKKKLYEVRPDSLVYAISLVECPAIESNFVYLSEEKPIQVCLEQDEKHMVFGAVLIPDKPIYRYNQDEEYYLRFPKETIEVLAHEYLQNDNIYSFTKQHKENADGVSIIESWVKTSNNDKSVDLGIDAPIGTWFVGAKIDNEEIWQGIKDGSMRGFSVESFLNFDEIMMNKQENKMTEEKLETIEVNESFWMRIAEIIKNALKNPEVPELEAQVTSAQVIDEMKDEVEKKEDEVVVEEMPTDEMPTEETPVMVSGEPEVIAEEVVEEVVTEAPTQEEAKEDLQVVIDELNKRIDELNAKISELELQNQKLSKQPSAKPVNVKGLIGGDNKFERMLAIMNGSAFK